MKSEKTKLLKYSVAVLILIGLYTLIMGVICHLKYNHFGYDDFDLAIHTQSLASILEGHTQTSILGIPFLGNHMVLILYLIAPIYALFSSALVLLYVQTFVLATGAWAIYALARKELDSRWGLALAFAYLIYPPLIYMNLYEFHPVALTSSGLIFAVLAWKKGYFIRFMTMLLLCMSCQENISLIAIGFGVYALFERKRWWWAVLPIIIGATYFAVVVQMIMPRLNDTVNFQMLYSHLGDSMPAVALTIISHPIQTAAFMLQPAKISFMNMLVSPLGYISLISPLSWIPAGLILLQRLLSVRGTESVTIYHYQAEFIPFVFIAAIYGIRNLRKLDIRVLKLLAAIFVIAFPLTAVLLSGIYPLIRHHTVVSPEQKLLIEAKHEVLKTIDDDATIATTFEFLSPLSHNKNLHSIHHISAGHFTLSDKPYPTPDNLEMIIIDTNDRLTFSPIGFYKPNSYINLQALLNTGLWKLAHQAESMVAIQHSDSPDPRLPLAKDIQTIPNTALTNITQTGEASFELVAFEIDSETSDNFRTVNLFWKTGATPNLDADMLLTVETPGTEIYEVILSPGSRFWPPQSWPTNSIIRDRHRIAIKAASPQTAIKVKMLPMTWQRGL